jgi:hypothetical protein
LPEHSPDPSGQFAPGERLGHIVIGAKPKADRPVNLGVPGAQHVRTWAEHDAVLVAALMARGVIDVSTNRSAP